jgi:hypothetical protein
MAVDAHALVTRARRGAALELGVLYAFGALGLLDAFATLGVAQKYTGTAAALVLFVVSPVVGAVALGALAWLERRLKWKQARVAAAVLLFVAAAALLVVYPHANTHAPDAGTDRDDAATIGARALLHGHSPYGQLTYLHQPVSQLPALLAVAAPFVGPFGSSAYELVVFLPLLYLLWRRLGRDPRVALGGLALALASPAFLREYLTGGDLIVNFVLVAAAVTFVWSRSDSAAAAVLLGASLATRANFAVVLLPLGVAVLRRRGRAVSARLVLVAAAVAAAIVAPFAATEGGRTALSMNDKLAQVPGGAPLVLSLAVLVALVAAWRTTHWAPSVLWWQIAAVQALFLAAVVVDDSARYGRPDFFWLISSYGVVAYLCGVAAVVARAAEPRLAP